MELTPFLVTPNVLPSTTLRFGDRVLVRSDGNGKRYYLSSTAVAAPATAAATGPKLEWVSNQRSAIPGLRFGASDRPWSFVIVGGPIGAPVRLCSTGLGVRVTSHAHTQQHTCTLTRTLTHTRPHHTHIHTHRHDCRWIVVARWTTTLLKCVRRGVSCEVLCCHCCVVVIQVAASDDSSSGSESSFEDDVMYAGVPWFGLVPAVMDGWIVDCSLSATQHCLSRQTPTGANALGFRNRLCLCFVDHFESVGWQ